MAEQIASNCPQVADIEKGPLVTKPAGCASGTDQAEDLLKRMMAGEDDYSHEDFTTVLVGILNSEEYRRCLAEEMAEHTARGRQKEGGPTAIERIEEAMEEFRKRLDELVKSVTAL